MEPGNIIPCHGSRTLPSLKCKDTEAQPHNEHLLNQLEVLQEAWDYIATEHGDLKHAAFVNHILIDRSEVVLALDWGPACR